MTDAKPPNPLAVLFHLEDPLVTLLAGGLRHVGCDVTLDVTRAAQIVFCAAAAGILQQALSQFGPVPVVVVSRLPEIGGWLDALEAGAADYCTAPFEPVQLRWLLDTHRRPLAAGAAA